MEEGFREQLVPVDLMITKAGKPREVKVTTPGKSANRRNFLSGQLSFFDQQCCRIPAAYPGKAFLRRGNSRFPKRLDHGSEESQIPFRRRIRP